MLTSVSNFQSSVYGGYSPQNSLAVEKSQADFLNKDSNALKLGESKKDDRAFGELSTEEKKEVDELKARDLEVRAHEQAHLNAAGRLAIGAASFTYTLGPDGKRYATGGEVSIDTSEVAGDPEATLNKADAIRRAAVAPASPSSQDQSVASKAAAMAGKARAELTQQGKEEGEGGDKEIDINKRFGNIPPIGSLVDYSA